MRADFNEAFMLRAIELSKENVSTNAGGPFGSVVAKNGKIISEGANQVTSANDPTAHAEIVAIRQACNTLGNFQLTGCQIYTSCEPCPMCLGAIYWARPDVVFYANTKADAAAIQFDDAFIYKELQVEPQLRSIAMVHKPSPLAQAVFTLWAAKPDKIAY